MSNQARYFLSSQTFLPRLTNLASSVLAILRACLITGAGTANVQTLTVAGGVATATFAAEHGFLPWQVVELAGATPSGLNGDARVASVPDAWTITYSTTVADGAATGSITCKLAPVGWQEAFTGTNVAVFKPTSIEANGLHLQVIDPAGTGVRVVGYETMSAVSTGTNPIPTEAQMSGGLHWYKSFTTNGTERAWALVVDDRGIYFFSDPDAGGYLLPFFAGDIESFKAGDAWGWLIAGYRTPITDYNFAQGNIAQNAPSFAATNQYLARNVMGAGAAVVAVTTGEACNTYSAGKWSGSAGFSFAATYPNPANNGLLLTRAEILEGAAVRGLLPGMYLARQNAAAAFQTGVVVDSSAGLPGRKLLAIRVGSATNAAAGVAFFDITDTWSR